MGFLHSFPNDIEKLCSLLIKSRCARFLFFIKYKNNTDFFEIHLNGQISQKTFLKYIHYSVDKSILRYFLPYFVDVIESSFITDEIVTELLNYSDVLSRNQAIIALSHKPLSEQQLLKLCETNQCFECYFEYLIRIYSNKETTEETFRKGIAMFLASPFAEMKNDLQKELKEIACTNQSKRLLLKLLS